MAVEIFVLGRQEGVDHPQGDRLDRHIYPFLGRVFDQQPAVPGVQARYRGRLVVGQLTIVRQITAVVVEKIQHAASAQQGKEQQRAE